MSRQRRHSRRIRLLTYNILLGGARREQLITNVLRRADADVVALQEVTNLEFLATLGRALRMEVIIGEPSDGGAMNLAVLTRLPVERWQNRTHRGRMLRSHLSCDVVTGGERVPLLRLHAVHLAARFGERAKGEARRMRELTAVLAGVRQGGDMPHVLIGDFNALAPRDDVAATAFFRRMAELRRARVLERQANGLVGPRRRGELDEEIDAAWLSAGIDPGLDVGIPQLPPAFYPVTALVPRSAALDRALGRLIERWTVSHLLDAGYVDCYRKVHPRAAGFTCATWQPAARIDYVFAEPSMASLLSRCEVVGSRRWSDADAMRASDHHPLVAEFAV